MSDLAAFEADLGLSGASQQQQQPLPLGPQRRRDAGEDEDGEIFATDVPASTADEDLRESLKSLQEQLRAARAELMFRKDELHTLKQQQRAKAASLRRLPVATASQRPPRGLVQEDRQQDKDEEENAFVQREAVEMMAGFLRRQLLPVAVKAAMPNPADSENVSKPDRSDQAGYFQVEVYANRQVCSLKIKSDSTFRELFVSVVSYWSLAPTVARQLALGDADGALFVDDLIVRTTMQAYAGTKARILLLPRSIHGTDEVRFEDVERFHPSAVAARVRRAEEVRALLHSQHVEAALAQRHSNAAAEISVGRSGIRESEEAVPGSTEDENEENIPDLDIERRAPSSFFRDIDALEESDSLNESDEFQMSSNENRPSLTVEEEARIDREVQHIFATDDIDADLDEPSISIPNALQLGRHGGSLARKQRTYHLVIDCLVFFPVLVLLVVAICIGCQRYVFVANFQQVSSQFRQYFEDYEPPPRTEVARDSNERLVAWNEVSDYESAYDWLNFTLESQVHNSINCENEEQQCYLNQYHQVVGHVRMRQVRVQPQECTFVFDTNCYAPYSMSIRDESEMTGTAISTQAGDPLTFVDARTATSLNDWRSASPRGPVDTLDLVSRYDGSGYVAVLSSDQGEITAANWTMTVSQLQNVDWINEGTRMVEIIFNTININTGSATAHVFLLQQTEMGAIEPVYIPETVPPSLFLKSFAGKAKAWMSVLGVGAMLYIVAYLIVIVAIRRLAGPVSLSVQNASNSRCKCCLQSFWQSRAWRAFHPVYTTLDILSLLSIASVFALEFLGARGTARAEVAGELVNFLDINAEPFFQNWGFHGTIHRHQVNLLAVTIVCVLLRGVRFMQLFRSGDILVRSWTLALRDILHYFFLIFLPLFLAFATTIFVVYAPYNPEIISFASSLLISMRLLFGFQLGALEIPEHELGWSLFITMGFGLLVVYFANILLTLVHIQSFATAALLPPRTFIRGPFDWATAAHAIIVDGTP
ncbi:Polycystin-2 [Hondaea fermentalgiana]|uniref:Polycystin-2 n=1 Tax=Hondaea fermentalgiana TaxID=2315210 RepID=A0A2R5GIY7_9STRA|nr:Polycystin-2 [Hondaea fermentalgiana]|eukprot:GBG30857.1 Polycystin-2 [Hondaea fermentalgiana]